MTVKELIEKLKEFPEDMEVFSFCNCYGHEIQTVEQKAYFRRKYDKDDYKGIMENLGDRVWIE